jgi:hypothetical protein
MQGNAGQTIWSEHFEGGTVGVWRQWQGRQVLHEGDYFLVRSDEPVDVTVSGYLLLLP